jgi:hypothetical protein
MRKTREVLRLYFELKLGQRQIARSANLSQSTVHEYLERFRAAGLNCPLPAEMSETELEAALFPTDTSPGRTPEGQRPLPDFAHFLERGPATTFKVAAQPSASITRSTSVGARISPR